MKIFFIGRLTKKYLAVYTCFIASERLFSDVGTLLTVKRTYISLTLFSKIIFLKQNNKYFNSIHPSLNIQKFDH